jgi:hypothetical protein
VAPCLSPLGGESGASLRASIDELVESTGKDGIFEVVIEQGG